LSLSKSVSLNEPTYFNIRRSLLSKKNADLSLVEKKKQIAYNIFVRYLNVLEAKRALEINTRNNDIQHKIYNQTLVLFNAGQKSLLELKKAEADTIQTEITVTDQLLTVKQAREDLFIYLNQKDVGKKLVEPQISTMSIDAWTYNNPLSMKQLQNNLKSSELSLMQNWLSLYPNFTLSYSLGYSNSDTGSLGSYKWDGSNSREYQSISFSVSYDIFNQLTQGESYARAKRSLRAQKINMVTTDRETRLAAKQNIADYEQQLKTYELTKKREELSQTTLQMAETEYSMGTISLIDLSKYRVDYLQAQLSLNSKYYGLLKKQESINLLLSEKILDKY